MLFALLAAVLAVVTTVLFITIGDSAPPFNMPQGAHNDQYGDKHKGNERARDRARRKKSSQEFDRKQKENGQSRVSSMQPLPVGRDADERDIDDDEEELEDELEELRTNTRGKKRESLTPNGPLRPMGDVVKPSPTPMKAPTPRR